MSNQNKQEKGIVIGVVLIVVALLSFTVWSLPKPFDLEYYTPNDIVYVECNAFDCTIRSESTPLNLEVDRDEYPHILSALAIPTSEDGYFDVVYSMMKVYRGEVIEF